MPVPHADTCFVNPCILVLLCEVRDGLQMAFAGIHFWIVVLFNVEVVKTFSIKNILKNYQKKKSLSNRQLQIQILYQVLLMRISLVVDFRGIMYIANIGGNFLIMNCISLLISI